MKPPPRLLDDATVSPELRSDLKRTTAAHYPYDSAAGLAGLHAAIGSATQTGTAAAGTQAKGAVAAKNTAWMSSTIAKSALLVAGGAAVVAATIIAWPSPSEISRAPASHRQPARAAEPVPVPAASAPIAATEPQGSVPPSARPAVVALPSELAVKSPPRSTGTLVGSARAPTAPVDGDEALRLEIEQLGRIKALLDENPTQAYRLAQAGHREFGTGMLREEREGLATLALWNMGRRHQARERARAFLARYHESALRTQLQQLLDGE